MIRTVRFLWICFIWFSKEGSKCEGRPGMKNKWNLEGTVRRTIFWVAAVARGLIKARPNNKWDYSRRRIQYQFKVPVLELCRNIIERLWCFSKLFFLKFLLMVTNNQLCDTSCSFLLVFYMVKSVSSSVSLSALMWAYIAAFNFPFIGRSFRTSFHYPVVWNSSQLLLFLSLLCSSAKQRLFPQICFLSSSPIKAELTYCYICKEPFIWMMQKIRKCTCPCIHWIVAY